MQIDSFLEEIENDVKTQLAVLINNLFIQEAIKFIKNYKNLDSLNYCKYGQNKYKYIFAKGQLAAFKSVEKSLPNSIKHQIATKIWNAESSFKEDEYFYLYPKEKPCKKCNICINEEDSQIIWNYAFSTGKIYISNFVNYTQI